jgi:hypothetical protein
MLATDWASTSGVERTRFCKVMPDSTAMSVWAVAIPSFLLFMNAYDFAELTPGFAR